MSALLPRPISHLPPPLVAGQPLTALAPMQDVTDLAFMRVIAHYGAPAYFFTEFFRVHAQSRPEKHILRSIDENTTGPRLRPAHRRGPRASRAHRRVVVAAQHRRHRPQ